MELFFYNPAFIAYLHELIDIHALMVRKMGDSSEADAIRDRSDELWEKLSQDERAELSRTSEFLYGIKV